MGAQQRKYRLMPNAQAMAPMAPKMLECGVVGVRTAMAGSDDVL